MKDFPLNFLKRQGEDFGNMKQNHDMMCYLNINQSTDVTITYLAVVSLHVVRQ